MSISSQQLESYLPVYDAIPEKWEEARPQLVERLKGIANAVNLREIGFFLDEELLSGKQFIPTPEMVSNDSSSSQVFRTVLRKVINTGALAVGAKSVPHGIQFDSNFTLIQLWVSATNSVSLQATTLVGTNVTMDNTNINIASSSAYDRSYAFVEYIQEI